jgi:hypothetical protein
MDGGTGTDTLNVLGTGDNDILNVFYTPADGIVRLESNVVDNIHNIENINADLGAGIDTLTYAGSTTGVTVALGTSFASGFNIPQVVGRQQHWWALKMSSAQA